MILIRFTHILKITRKSIFNIPKKEEENYKKEEIIPKKEFTKCTSADICIRFASKAFSTGGEYLIKDISQKGIQKIIENVHNGNYKSLYLSLDPYGEIDGNKYFTMESTGNWIAVQIVDDNNKTWYSSFDIKYLDSEEISPIECSDRQSGILKKYTIHDRKLAAECIEWFIRTSEPYPGMEWIKTTT